MILELGLKLYTEAVFPEFLNKTVGIAAEIKKDLSLHRRTCRTVRLGKPQSSEMKH